MRRSGACLLVLAVWGWTGCGSQGAEGVVLKLWKATHGETREDWKKLLAPFEAAHPGLRVEVLSHPWEGWDERYAAAFAGGTAPDVAYMPEEFWPRYAAAGRLARLDELFPEALAAMEAEYPENLWRQGALGGHRYAIPYLYVSYQLFYNQRLFDEAGLPYPPATPEDEDFDAWTWKRFARTARKLTRDLDGDGATDQWGFAWSAMSPNPNIVYPFLWQAGADLLNEDHTANGFGARGVRGLRFVQQLAAAGVLPEGGLHPNVQELFYEGRAGMTLAGSAQILVLRRDFPHLEVGAAIVPRGPAEDFFAGRGTFGNSGFWVIAASAPHKEKALALVRFLGRRENVQTMMDLIHLFGARLDWTPPQDDPLVRTFAAGRRFLVPYPLHPRLRQIHSAILPEVQAMLLGRKTPRQAIADAALAVDELLARP